MRRHCSSPPGRLEVRRVRQRVLVADQRGRAIGPDHRTFFLHPAVVEQDAAADRAHLVVFVGRVDQRLEPTVGDDDVIVQQHEHLAPGFCTAPVASTAEALVDRRGEDAHSLDLVAQRFEQSGRGLVERHNHLEGDRTQVLGVS